MFMKIVMELPCSFSLGRIICVYAKIKHDYDLRRCLCSRALKDFIDGADVMFSGRLFQSFAPEYEKLCLNRSTRGHGTDRTLLSSLATLRGLLGAK